MHSLRSCNSDWGWGGSSNFKESPGKPSLWVKRWALPVPGGGWGVGGGGQRSSAGLSAQPHPLRGQLGTAHTQHCFGLNGLEASFPFLLQMICLEFCGLCIYLCRLGTDPQGHWTKQGQDLSPELAASSSPQHTFLQPLSTADLGASGNAYVLLGASLPKASSISCAPGMKPLLPGTASGTTPHPHPSPQALAPRLISPFLHLCTQANPTPALP